MIDTANNVFHISTQNTSYLFAVTSHGDLQQLYYGARIARQSSYAAFFEKRSMLLVSTLYPEGDVSYGIDALNFEYSSLSNGDMRESACCIQCGETMCSFVYAGYELLDCAPRRTHFAQTHGCEECLCVKMVDSQTQTRLYLYYLVFPECDVITRYTQVLTNTEPITIDSLMSLQIDFSQDDMKYITFDGAWARERFKHEQTLKTGKYICDSQSGASGARHNPFVMLTRENADNFSGDSYGFNLIYSGNHRSVCEVSTYGGVRFLIGISPTGFRYTLHQGKAFFTPEAVMTYSPDGYNGVSAHMHSFVTKHVLKERWSKATMPVLLNSWETVYFDVSEEKLRRLADCAEKIGVELLVLDDGWFSERNDDTSSLGDWQVNRSKFPTGLQGIAAYIHKKGMRVGVWLEPEMISKNSRLFASHPDWALGTERGRTILGRNQYILDLSRTDVQDFIVETVCGVIQESGADYIKWDFNRMFSDFTSCVTPAFEVQHQYICGLYRVLDEITRRAPHVLFEMCASGGARFDLGMLCYMPLGWTSDNTDVYARALIQEGTGYAYPVSTMCNHISAVPNHQTGRVSSLETRYSIAAFGVLGLQYDLTAAAPEELAYLKNCIKAYRRMRHLINGGSFYRLLDGFQSNFSSWMLVSEDKRTAFVLLFQKLFSPVSQLPKVRLCGLQQDSVYAVEQTGVLASGGVLMKHGMYFLQNYQGNEQSEAGHYLTDFSAIIYKLQKVGEQYAGDF